MTIVVLPDASFREGLCQELNGRGVEAVAVPEVLSMLRSLSLLGILLAVAGPTGLSQTRLPPVFVDRYIPPTSIRDAVTKAEVTAVVRLVGQEFEDDHPMLGGLVTRFTAQVVEVISDPGERVRAPTIVIIRHGGQTIRDGQTFVQEENRFPPWKVGRTMVLFLIQADDGAFHPRFGPDCGFERSEVGLANSNGRGGVARTLHGRSFDEVLGLIRAAAKGRGPGRQGGGQIHP